MEDEWENPGEQQQVDEDEEDILDMGDDDKEANEREGLLMRFCPHDSSMLYPQVGNSTKEKRRLTRCLDYDMCINMMYLTLFSTKRRINEIGPYNMHVDSANTRNPPPISLSSTATS